MQQDIIIRNGTVFNRGQRKVQDVWISKGRIKQVGGTIDPTSFYREIDATGLWVMPGIIDDQVHFREPGLTHKANIATESMAALAGGVTSFMEMPNTKPPATTQAALQEKYEIAARVSPVNYSFFMGATNDNLEEVLHTHPENVCGIKVFMGSSTGNMLVDNPVTLEQLFAACPMLIATHCEDEQTVRNNEAIFKEQFGEDIPMDQHPIIRSVDACYLSSSMAVDLAKKHNTRLHILHISTEKELSLFRNDIPLSQKRITAEVCVHHLYFNANDYAEYGSKIKCNPAIKSIENQMALLPALLDDRLDIIATDHAPHLMSEKQQSYFHAPSGVPLIQHTLNMMLTFEQAGKISMERIVEKMCHAPAECFRMVDRGYLDEGSWADVVLVNPNHSWEVHKDNLLYKCGWSPFEGKSFKGKVVKTIVNGTMVWENNQCVYPHAGQRLQFRKMD